ncbi:glycosyltransferase [Shimia sp. FJ5]|uniref:glycosyltransferase n=1 Tax=Shimia sp. FJ5 TaxID=3079054 RepID=UPI00262837EF|nr:glycosyltransferase [Shimia sp. FJ5]MDV4144714.1 glycosyltransferase [Shimia sp. FJ5]
MEQKKNAGRLVAVVVTHNRLSHLKACVERLLESPEHLIYKVLVVDNASEDGTQAWLSDHADPRLCNLRIANNIGGAGGFEAGMRFAMETFSPDWLLLTDDDGRPYPDTLKAFHQSPPPHQSVATAVYFPDGTICDINRPSRNPFWHMGNFFRTLLGGGREGFHLNASDYQSRSPQEVDGASFVGLFVSRRAVEMAGYPRGDLFIYGDDILYTLTLRMAGGTILFDPALRFEHDHRTKGVGEKRLRPLWKTYYYHRNLLVVYRAAAGVWFWPVLMIILPRWIAKTLHYPGNRREFLGLLRCAIRDGLASDLNRPHSEVVARSEGRFTA